MASSSLMLPLLWSSLLLFLLIPISLLPYECNAGSVFGKQTILSENSVDIEQIIKEVRAIYKTINRHEDVAEIELLHNKDASTNEAVEYFKQMAEQNVKDESSMEEVIKIFEQMPMDWKENIDGKLFKDALIAKIAFNRFMAIFLEKQKQEIVYEKSLDSSSNGFVKVGSFQKRESFKKNCAYNILAIFTLANYKEINLLKQVDLTIGIVGNAVKFYKIDELKYQGSEIKDMMDKQREQMDKFEKWLKKMHNDFIVNDKNDKLSDDSIAQKIVDALVNKDESPFVDLHVAIKKDEIFVKYAMQFMNTENEEKAKNAIQEVKEIFEQMPDKKWRLNRVREPSPLLEDAIVAKIVYNRFKELFQKHANVMENSKNVLSILSFATKLDPIQILSLAMLQNHGNADHQNAEKNSENILDILNLTTKYDPMQLLSFRVKWTILAIDRAIKFYKYKENPYITIRIKNEKTEEWEAKKELKKKMAQQMEQMVTFKKWMDEKVEKIIAKPGIQSEKMEQEMAKKIIKLLQKSGSPFAGTATNMGTNEIVDGGRYRGSRQYNLGEIRESVVKVRDHRLAFIEANRSRFRRKVAFQCHSE